MKEGIIYCVRNPLFPHIVKIGKTTQETVKGRGLDTSNVPEDFDVIWAYKVDDIDTAEASVHSAVGQFRYMSKSGRSTEFFYELAVEQAEKHICKAFKRKGKGIEITESYFKENNDVGIIDEKYEPDPKYNDFVSWEDLRLMRGKNDPFITKDDAKIGWINALNFLRMTIVRQAKKQGAWADKKISLSWLKESGFFEKIMEVQYKDD